MALPTVEFKVGFDFNPGDTVNWGPGGTTPAADLSSRVEYMKISRGRQMELDQVEVGTMDLVLRNKDKHLDPSYSGGPYFGKILPVKQCRMRATVLSVTYDLFTGDSWDWDQAWSGRENVVPLKVVDAFDMFRANEDGVTSNAPSELTGARVNRILDAIGWPTGASFRDIDAGQTTLAAHNYVNENALDALQKVAVTWERGLIFTDETGRVVFHDRHHRLIPPATTSQVTIFNVPTGAQIPHAHALPRYDNERIKNRVAFQHVGGSEVVVLDTTSKTKFRQRTLREEIEASSSTQVADLANYTLGRLKDPLFHIEEVTIEPQDDDDAWAHCLGRKLGDRVTVIVQPPGTTANSTTYISVIEKIEHVYVPGRWTTKWRLSPADLNNYWILGDASSSLGSNTRLGA